MYVSILFHKKAFKTKNSMSWKEVIMRLKQSKH